MSAAGAHCPQALGAQPPTDHGPLQRGLGGPPNEPDGLRTFVQENVSGTFARDVLDAFIAQSTHINVVQEMLCGTKQDRLDSEMQLVNQASAEILPNRGYAATHADVAAVCRDSRLLQSGVNAFG